MTRTPTTVGGHCTPHGIARCTICGPVEAASVVDALAFDIAARHPGKPISTMSVERCEAALLAVANTDIRVTVRNTKGGWSRSGRVRFTDGWTPVVILVPDAGAPRWLGADRLDVLGRHDTVTGVKLGDSYRAVVDSGEGDARRAR